VPVVVKSKAEEEPVKSSWDDEDEVEEDAVPASAPASKSVVPGVNKKLAAKKQAEEQKKAEAEARRLADDPQAAYAEKMRQRDIVIKEDAKLGNELLGFSDEDEDEEAPVVAAKPGDFFDFGAKPAAAAKPAASVAKVTNNLATMTLKNDKDVEELVEQLNAKLNAADRERVLKFFTKLLTNGTKKLTMEDADQLKKATAQLYVAKQKEKAAMKNAMSKAKPTLKATQKNVTDFDDYSQYNDGEYDDYM